MQNEFLSLKNQRYKFHIIAELQKIENLNSCLPKENETHFYISNGGFSSIGFVKFIADRTKIRKLQVSSLRIGKKHLQVLDVLKKQGKLDECDFVVGSVMKNDSKLGKSYGYYDDLLKICEKNNWSVTVANNHSKILNFDTDDGKFVIWTSSNLNENPNIEQFVFLKSEDVYEMCEKHFFEKIKKEGVHYDTEKKTADKKTS